MSFERLDLDAPVRDICIVLLTGLGDVIHGLPVANALKRSDPTQRITWAVERYATGGAKGAGDAYLPGEPAGPEGP